MRARYIPAQGIQRQVDDLFTLESLVELGVDAVLERPQVLADWESPRLALDTSQHAHSELVCTLDQPFGRLERCLKLTLQRPLDNDFDQRTPQ